MGKLLRWLLWLKRPAALITGWLGAPVPRPASSADALTISLMTHRPVVPPGQRICAAERYCDTAARR